MIFGQHLIINVEKNMKNVNYEFDNEADVFFLEAKVKQRKNNINFYILVFLFIRKLHQIHFVFLLIVLGY